MKGIRPYMLVLLGILLIGCRPIYVQLECPHKEKVYEFGGAVYDEILPGFKYPLPEYWNGYEMVYPEVKLHGRPDVYFDSIKISDSTISTGSIDTVHYKNFANFTTGAVKDKQ